MTAEACALAQVLLDHHRTACSPGKDINSCLIFYGSLCDRAHVPHLVRSVGHFLCEVAEWCEENGWPPINALAVNRGSRMPGEGYDGAPGCSLTQWPDEARATVDFESYPATTPRWTVRQRRKGLTRWSGLASDRRDEESASCNKHGPSVVIPPKTRSRSPVTGVGVQIPRAEIFQRRSVGEPGECGQSAPDHRSLTLARRHSESHKSNCRRA
jgi:hypothetical protein